MGGTAVLILTWTVTANALLGLAYRLYRHSRGGPISDVWGQAVLAALLLGLAGGLAAGAEWLRWSAMAYALLFGLVVMPIWTLAVLIPLPPRPIDYAFAATYWILLVVILIGAWAA